MTDTARRGWTLIAPTQSNKATTANDRFQDIEDALDDLLSVDLTAGSATLSAAQWSASAGFYLTGTSTSGRTVTVPAQEGPRDFLLAAAWTHSVDIVRGATTVTLQPGKGIRLFATGSADGLLVVASSDATIGGVPYSAIASRAVKHGAGFLTALDAAELFDEVIFDEAVDYAANYAGSYFHCATPDAVTATVLTVKKITAGGSSSTLGTITIGTSGTITVSVSAHSMAAGDRRTIEGPGTATTAARFVGVLVGAIP